MMRRISFLVLVLATAFAGTSAAAVGDDFLARVDQDVTAGSLSYEEGLLAKFHYAFDPDRLSPKVGDVELGPIKCFTHVIIDYYANKGELSPEAVATIEGYLAPPDKDSEAIYISPSGHFQLTYSTVGGDAVPAADTNPPNGVPDFVERCAEYMDYSWATECDDFGFMEPTVLPGTYYDVSFENMGPYGYTQPLGGGRTRIVLHCNFFGFPANDDPDGDQLGAAKVTAAHEFKHASQYTNSNWSEGGWVELDATAMEEAVYPLTNDYHNYLSGESPVKHPEIPLNGGSVSTGSYEDCVWEIFWFETWGIEMVVDLWNYRRGHQAENMVTSYYNVLLNWDSSLRDAWADFTAWNYLVGARAVDGFSYVDAAQYPQWNPIPADRTNVYPWTWNGLIDRLAANFRYCYGFDGSEQSPQIDFNGQNNVDLTLGVAAVFTDDTFQYVRIELDENNDASIAVPINLADCWAMGIIVGDGHRFYDNRTYSLSVDLTDLVVSDAGEDGTPRTIAVDGVFPNPFNPRTNIKFRLPETGHTVVEVVDVRGRLIDTVFRGQLEAGQHSVTWDGRDASGRLAAAGNYFAVVRADGHMATAKMVLAK